MSAASDWARAKALFQAALEREPDERAAWIARAAGDDHALRTEVEGLLAAHIAAASQLDGEARDLLAGTPEEPQLPPAIGPFLPTALLGRGGMGVVYRGERTVDGGVQTVALKCIAAGFADPALVRRFERERAILARLAHPHIAHFIDGGVGADGSPWFAMAYVDGENLLQWCDRERLSPRARVRLFLQVLDAVAFAHRHLVVHRDLKPSNILVDRAGQVRLLDFGIAKLLDDAEAATLTLAAGPMTPEYAAPEQVAGETVSTATDIHGLGLVLFELLTGRLPYAAANASAWVAAVRDSEPGRLRDALARASLDSRRNLPASELAKRRSLSETELKRAFDRDLEQVLAIALARVPAERYANAEAFAADLEAWLEDRPLRSRPAGWRVRGRKFLRRHRAAVAVGAALVLVGAAGIVATVWQARLAEAQAARAEAARRVLSQLFQAADPQSMDGRALSARELVDQAAARLHDDRGMDSELRASLLTDLAAVYRSLGEPGRARRLLGEVGAATGIRMETRAQALLQEARAAISESDHDGAKRLTERLAGLLKAQAATDPLRIELSLLRAETAYQRQELGSVVAGLQDLLRLLPAEDPERMQARADALLLLGEAESDRQHPELALGHLREALRLYQRSGASAATLNSTRHEIARVLGTSDRFDEALPMLRTVLAEHTRVFGSDHPLSLSTKGEIANLLRRQNRFEEASALFLELIEAKRRTLGPDHDDLAVAQMNYGLLHYFRDDFARALPHFEEAARIWTRTLGPDGERTLTARDALAVVHAELGQHERAIAEINAVVAARERAGENDSLVSALNSRGVVFDRARRLPESCAQFRRAIAITTRLQPDAPEESRWTRALLGRCLRRSGDLAAAATELRFAHRSFHASTMGPGPRTAIVAIELARTLRAQAGAPAAIDGLYQEAIRLRRDKLEPGHARTAEAERERDDWLRGEALPAAL